MLTVYEVILLLRNIPKDELAASVRRTAGYVLQKNGFFRDIQYMGLQKVPYRLSKDKTPFWEANYFFYEFNAPKVLLPVISDEWKRDRDVIKYSILARERSKPINYDDCTFEDEMKPVPYRSEVKTLVTAAKRYTVRRNKRMKLNTSCSFFPFQR